jgi:hypothetical protein
MQLPIGSDVGIYEVQIRKTGQVVGTGGKGQANIENGITTLTVTLDTTDIPVGDYEIAWRLDSFDWRSYPIRVPQ